jgi:hypothetical protein
MARTILTIFKHNSGLSCNPGKCQLAPIRCSEEQVELVTGLFPCQLVTFLIRYLGIPFSIAKLPRSVLHPLVEHVADRLPTWKGRLLYRAGWP